MPGIDAFKQYAIQHPAAARVRVGGGGDVKAHGAMKGRVVEAFTRDSKLRTENKRVVESFVGALRAAYGDNVATAAYMQHLQGIHANRLPLSAHVITAAISAADAEVRYQVNQACAGGATSTMSDLLHRMQGTDPTGYAQFVQARLTDLGTSNATFTRYFVACPDDPMAHGAGAHLARLDAPTLNAMDLQLLKVGARGSQNPAEHVAERFRQVPGLKLANGVWSATPGSNLDTIAGKLNDFQRELFGSRLGDPISASVTQFCHAQHLDVKAQNRLLAKIQDKLLTGDLLERQPPGVSFRGELAAGKLESLYQVAAEFLTRTQLDSLVGGLNYDQTARLVANAFAGRTVAYSSFKEGSVNLMAALERRVATPPEIKQLITNLRSEFFDADALFAAVQGQPAIDAPTLGNLTAAETITANNAAAALKTDFDQKRPRAKAILNHFLGQIPPGGTLTDAQFRAKTGLTVDQARDLVPLLDQSPSAATARKFAQTFGANVALPDLDDPTAQLAVPTFQPSTSGVQAVAQLAWQFSALHTGGQNYLDGLSKMAMVLPTAGKDLSTLTFLETMAKSVSAVVVDSGVVGADASDYPILVFDQSSGTRLTDNKLYIDQLALSTGTRIERVTMQQVDAVAQKLGITGMFDTTGTGRAGFGGARNIANLLGPVFDKAIKDDPTRTVADVVNMSANELKQLVKDTALTNDQMILMGDDDASVHPGFLHAKALIAREQEGEYVTAKTQLVGRNSTQGSIPNDPSAYLAGGVDSLKMVFLGSVTWSNTDMKPVMAAALSHPGACLNLPTPTEESHVAVYEGFTDILSKGLHHATDRYDELGSKVKSYLSYTQQAGLTDALLDCGTHFSDSLILPWNHATGTVMQKGDRTLKDVFQLAGLAATKTGMQKAFFDNLAGFQTKPNIQPILNLDYDTVFATPLGAPNLSPTSRRELIDARDSYKAVQRDMQTAVDFRNRLFGKLVTDFGNVPGLNQDAAWGIANLGTDADKIKWLIDQHHDVAQRVTDVRAEMLNPPTSLDANSADQNPLTQIVFLSAKSIGAGQFNDLAGEIASW